MFSTFDPFRDFARLAPARLPVTVPYDTLRFDDRFELRFDVPGVDPDGIELTVDGRELTLTFDRTSDIPEDATLVARRRPTGEVRQSLHLGESLDVTGLAADYDKGVLVVTIPVAEQAMPRKVPVAIGVGAGTDDTA
ncbi:MAG: Hsp20/alpha crystallin family protein [Acidimicrobiia bacterium]|nr:Hsp20/alpha crystallin family protein [Acidimicrobiia bacterium]